MKTNLNSLCIFQVTGTKWTQGHSADVTYYITDAGTILNATYAVSILKRLTLNDMSSVTSPYSVNSTPRPSTPTNSGTSDNDDEYPSWFIPVVVGGCVGFLLLVIIIILYCRWKKGAPPKKIQPTEEQVQKPRVSYFCLNTFPWPKKPRVSYFCLNTFPWPTFPWPKSLIS